ncbi:MAG: SAM-dependent methyltransferase [Acidimicrobiia bacterium]|nr:class I SAM-dependent methyltransferase [bacterium]MXX65108.1 SAM-dependent methyltransferase [Acidimicrobiia bacterium]MCY3579258.1 class I SAM-dependent methyltransferase [bacterium]MCY3652598.1 class I SAM-dependent methyltransferase [bacterium]MDE0643829.1 class I SAM-dependent methyltransferase [bacterium]
MSSGNAFIPPDIYQYILDDTLRDDPLSRRLREETALLPESNMQIAPDQGRFMALLVRMMGAERIIEVGVFTGYSSLCMARALPETGLLVACDVSVEYTDVARRYWKQAGVSDRIDLRIGPALETLDELIRQGREEEFDLAFIDADKENYPDYYEKCLVLVRPGGLLIIDNTLWSGRVADPTDQDQVTSTIRNLNARVGQDDRLSDVSLLPIGDGLLLARRR